MTLNKPYHSKTKLIDRTNGLFDDCTKDISQEMQQDDIDSDEERSHAET